MVLHGIYSQHCVHNVNINKLANQKRFLKMNCLYRQCPSCQELSLVTLCTVLLHIFLPKCHLFKLRNNSYRAACNVRHASHVCRLPLLLLSSLSLVIALKAILQSLRSRMLTSFSPFFFTSLLMVSMSSSGSHTFYLHVQHCSGHMAIISTPDMSIPA